MTMTCAPSGCSRGERSEACTSMPPGTLGMPRKPSAMMVTPAPLFFFFIVRPLPYTYYSPRGADLHVDLPIQCQHPVAVRRRAEFRTHPLPPRRSHALRRRHREPLYARQDVDQRI